MSVSFHPAVDPRFQSLIPPLSDEERAGLEADIRAEGCRDALIVWKEKGVLLDGHNRLDICRQLEIDYRVERVSFESREAATNWVIDHQLHRRNLHPDQISRLRGMRYNLEKAQGKRTDLTSCQNDTKLQTAARLASEYGTSARTITRDGKFADACDVLDEAGIDTKEIIGKPSTTKAGIIEAAEKLKDGEITRAEAADAVAHNHRAQGTGENEWYTPSDYIDAAREVMGGRIALDPASSEIANREVMADRFYSIDDDGLEQSWEAETIWMNPPYSQPAIRLFSEKLVHEWSAGHVGQAIALTHNYTDTAWFHAMASVCNAICFTRGRIGFLSPEGKKAAPTQGQAFFYFGSDVERFRRVFGRFGLTVLVMRDAA